MSEWALAARASLPTWWAPERAEADGDGPVEVVAHPLVDGDEPWAPPQWRLQGAVLAARRRRLASPSVSAAPDRPVERWVHGHCVGNTLCLLDELSRRSIDCRPVTGSLRADAAAAESPPRTASDAVAAGVQHHWAEARVEGRWWVVDLAQYRNDPAAGAPYVGLTAPPVYRTYPDSRRFAADYFDRTRRHLDVGVVGAPGTGREDWDLSRARIDARS